MLNDTINRYVELHRALGFKFRLQAYLLRSVKSTEIYLRADPTEKLEALEAGVPPKLRPGRFQVPDRLLAMLRSP